MGCPSCRNSKKKEQRNLVKTVQKSVEVNMEDEHRPPLSPGEVQQEETLSNQPASKKPKLEWQEALITLMAAQ